jgi:hypothetical protein
VTALEPIEIVIPEGSTEAEQRDLDALALLIQYWTLAVIFMDESMYSTEAGLQAYWCARDSESIEVALEMASIIGPEPRRLLEMATVRDIALLLGNFRAQMEEVMRDAGI